jgi:hypothetical protein
VSGYAAEGNREPCLPITLQGPVRGALLIVISYRMGGYAAAPRQGGPCSVTPSGSRSDTVVGLALGLSSHDRISYCRSDAPVRVSVTGSFLEKIDTPTRRMTMPPEPSDTGHVASLASPADVADK